MARFLTGQWWHAKADDPDTFVEALACALSEYPALIVQECCDPRVGLFKVREMPPSGVAVHEWCSKRLHLYRGVAKPKLVAAERPPAGKVVRDAQTAVRAGRME